jgi:DNA-binding transcriptional LysR family regulator
MADATGMAHAVIDRSLEKHKIPRTISLRVPGFQMLPAIVANSELAAIIPGRLADTYGRHLPIKVLPTSIPMPAFDIRLFWHERYHHDPPHRCFDKCSSNC